MNIKIIDTIRKKQLEIEKNNIQKNLDKIKAEEMKIETERLAKIKKYEEEKREFQNKNTSTLFGEKASDRFIMFLMNIRNPVWGVGDLRARAELFGVSEFLDYIDTICKPPVPPPVKPDGL